MGCYWEGGEWFENKRKWKTRKIKRKIFSYIFSSFSQCFMIFICFLRSQDRRKISVFRQITCSRNGKYCLITRKLLSLRFCTAIIIFIISLLRNVFQRLNTIPQCNLPSQSTQIGIHISSWPGRIGKKYTEITTPCVSICLT